MRLDKYVSNALQITRNDAKKLIQKKEISVFLNGELKIVNSSFDVKEEKEIYQNKELIYKEYIYLMMNKPKGFICANFDKNNKTVYDLITGYKTNELSIIGRLDIDTEGLIIITNDGDLVHKITSPKNEHVKRYYCLCENDLKESDIKAFSDGIVINNDGELYKCRSANLIINNDKECIIEIKEGKFHQIKKMMHAISNNVLYLKRISIANIILDDNLKLGEYRELTEEEVIKLKNC